MSMLNVIKAKLGQAANTAHNFLFDASAANGTMKLSRESGQDILTVDASGNVLVGGNNLNLFSAKSLATNGYQKLPSGLIIQWGYVGCPANYIANTRFAFNLPIAFPSSALSIILSNSGTNNSTAGTQTGFISLSRAEVAWSQGSANADGLAATYVAFGF